MSNIVRKHVGTKITGYITKMNFIYMSKLHCNHIYQYAMYIPKLGRDVNSIVLKIFNDQTISLRILNKKHGYAAVKYVEIEYN